MTLTASDKKLIVAAVVAVAILSVWTTTAVIMKTRGLRNNNPGNIREPANGGDKWFGERATDDDPAFEEFNEMWHGVRAALIIFKNYQSRYGLRTVRGLIYRWAPPNENDTAAYIAAVCARIGVLPDDQIDLKDFDTANKFLRAVFRHECGVLAETLVTADDMRRGIEAA